MEFSFSHLVRNCSDAIKFQEVFVQFCCRSPHGERGLKFSKRASRGCPGRRRSPHGERGLKSESIKGTYTVQESLPTRGAWIEILRSWRRAGNSLGRSPHGERGLKFNGDTVLLHQRSRSPHGERGLKCMVWANGARARCRSPHGERGLKYRTDLFHPYKRSRSPHGERGLKWPFPAPCPLWPGVAPHTGSVD